jgi:predicted enzyme related to lactoylglutathione lyase
MIRDMMSVAVPVADAKKSAEWFQEKLSFEVAVDGHWVTAKPKGSKMVLHLCEECMEWAGGRPGGQTGIAFSVDDVEKTYQQLKENGVQFSKALTKAPFGICAIFKDLDGNEFWIW